MGFLSGLTALSSIASEYGEAKNENRQEALNRQQKLHQMSSEDAYLQLAKQAAQRQQEEFDFRKKSGDLIEMKDGRVWSVSQGKFIDQQRPDPMVTLRHFIQSQPPEVQKNLSERAQAEVELNPNDPKAAIQEVMKFADAENARREAETNRKEDATTRHQEHEEDVSDQREWQAQQRKLLENFQREMVDTRLEEKYKFLNPQERRLLDTARQMEPKVAQLEDLISKAGLQNSDDAIWNKNSAAMQHLRMYAYKAGVKPDQLHADLIKTAAALQVMGAAPWMQMSRSKYMYETVKQHLPSPTDTPALLYDKAQFLHGIITELKDSLAEAGVPYGAAAGASQSAPASNADPLGVLGK
jgi:hypothetical protein